MNKKAWLVLFFVTALFPRAQAVPDIRDSVILESKRVATTPSGHPAFALKVYITNKDSLAILTLALRAATVSGPGYVPLDSLSGNDPDEQDGWTLTDCLTYLKSTLDTPAGEDFTRYNGSSPDSFLVASSFLPTPSNPMRRAELPNAVRSAIWELQFMATSHSLGTIELDTSGGLPQGTLFTVVKQNGTVIEDAPVNFAKGTITLDPKPNWAPIGDQFVIAGQPLIFSVTASDPSGTFPVLSAVPVPAGATFTNFGDGTGQFSWTPTASQLGLHPVAFIASDGLQADTELVAILVLAEQLQEHQNGGDIGDQFGWAVSGGGDINFDAAADYIIGAPLADKPGPGTAAATLLDAGSIYVYSGTTDTLVYQKSGDGAGDRLGGSVGLVGDANNDGYADFIASAPGANDSAGAVYVYSGSDGSLLFQKTGASSGDRLGGSIGISGDVIDFSGDSRADLIVGAEGTNDSTGAAYIYSGADGSLLRTITGGAPGDRLGAAVGFTYLEDVNGDARADYIIGAPGVDSSAGAVYAYSGSDGSLLFQQTGAAAGDLLGSAVGISADVNLDGAADFIVGAPGTNDSAGAAYVYSGADGSVLSQQAGGSPGDRIGGSVGIFADADGSAPRLLFGAPGEDPGGAEDAGGTYVYGIASCAGVKGDLNGDGGKTPADVGKMLLCVYTLGYPGCDLCFSDVNCSGDLTPADVALELLIVYVLLPPPC